MRYADETVIMAGSEAEARKALKTLSDWMDRSGFKLHPEKTRVVDMSQNGNHFDFLDKRIRAI